MLHNMKQNEVCARFSFSCFTSCSAVVNRPSVNTDLSLRGEKLFNLNLHQTPINHFEVRISLDNSLVPSGHESASSLLWFSRVLCIVHRSTLTALFAKCVLKQGPSSGEAFIPVLEKC